MEAFRINICLLLVVVESCVGASTATGVQEMGYKEALEKVIQSINNENAVNKSDMLRVMPTNQEEANVFYRLDYDTSTSNAFQRLDKMIVENVRSGDADFMIKYLRMSPYVDGYFAEAYFDNIDHLSSNDQMLFCSSYKILSDEEKRRLMDFAQCE